MTSLAEQERQDLGDFLSGLEAEQWEAPSLCEGWRVRDVVAHIVSYGHLGVTGLAKRFVQGRLLLTRINSLGVAELDSATPAELLALLRRHTKPQGPLAAFGGRIALVDGLIHHQASGARWGCPGRSRGIASSRRCRSQ